GDVILVLDYGPTEETTGPGSLRDVLVTTVAPAEPLADLVGDINRDDAITPADPADNGEAEDKPSGLPVAIGSLEKLSLRCVPKSRTEGFVRFTVMSGAGEWEHLRDPARLPRPRRPGGGRIRVWEDQEKTKLILDSHTLGKMDVVWALSETFPIDRIPTTVYAEGVAVSREAGDVVLVLNYGLTEATTGPGSLQDVLVATVSKATLPRVRVARASDNAEQLAIWIFEHVDRPPPAPPGTPSILLNDPMTPKYEDVVGAPTLTMLHADIEPVDVGGRAYTDVEGRPHGVTLAAGWEDIKKKGGAADAEFIVKIATTGWKDIEVRFDYKSDSADDFELDYSLDDGTQWTAARGPVGLVDGGNWQALPFVDLSSVDAIENLPEVIFRFYDFKDTGNDMFWFDNLEFIGDRIPPNIPTIEVATTTTPYLKLPAQNEGYASGVISDPTDPARTLGIDFVIADLDTPLDRLTVTAVAVPTGQAELVLSGTGANRNLKITPLLVGYADINVKVTDGAGSSTYVVRYAASAAALNPAGPRFHTGVSDVSAATAIDANTMLVASDEDRSLWLYHRSSSGLHAKGIDTAPWLALTSSRETDIEGCARDGARAYWIGSHGNNSSGKYRDNRCRLFATTISGTGDQASAAKVGWYGNLRVDLIAWDKGNVHGKGANYYGLEASTAIGIEPKRDDGFNIEGLAMGADSSTVYVGFRAPIVPANDRTKALIVPVTNVQALVSSSPSAGPATFGPPIELNLGGRGVRSMARTTSGGYIIVAGPTTNATGISPSDFRLYSWSGNPLAAPALLQNDLTGLSTGGSFEAIVEPVGGVGGTIQLLNDNGTTDWYGDKAESKTLNANWQKFRSDYVTPGAPVPGAPFAMTMGGTGNDTACSVVRTLDGGSVVIGYTNSSGAGKYDLWVCKLDRAGGVAWQKTYGGPEDDCSTDIFKTPCIRQTPDGGYIVATSTASFGAGATDVWVLRLAADGSIIWQKTYGGDKWEAGLAVAVCSDGSFAVGCTTGSFGIGKGNIWVLKLKADGTILWQTVYNETQPRTQPGTHLVGIEEMAGGELLVTGNTFYAPCLLKLSSTGALRWAIDYGDSNNSGVARNGVKPTSDGGCVVVSGADGPCVQKIDANGRAVWHRTYDGPGKVGEEEEALLSHVWAIDETPDEGYIIGTTCLHTRDTGTYIGRALLRVDSTGAPLWCRYYRSVTSDDEVRTHRPDLSDYLRERPNALTACPDGTYLMVGKSKVLKATGRDMLILRVQADGTVPGYDTPFVPVKGEGAPPKHGGLIEMSTQATTVIGVDTSIAPVDSQISPN
ncbi:MAG: DUF3616 domain-containing protein, partial [Victivallales bacterium]|nr:DUF3616 domain-containing protein [Victivallales bacterium]